jgi:hypothetical protein
MKGGITHRIEEAVKALEEGKLKKALFLTDNPKTERHHGIVVAAARQCLAKKEECPDHLQDAAQKLKDTITPPLDETDLEGVEELLGEPGEKPREKTDEELYQNCEECHVSNAVVQFHEIAEGCGDTKTKEVIKKGLENEDTPEQWLKTMIEIAEKESCGKESYVSVVGELVDYLDGRDSPILTKLDEGGQSG